MEKEMQPQSLSTLKMMGEKTVDNPSASDNPLVNLGEAGKFDSPNLHSSPTSELLDQANVGTACTSQDHCREGPNYPLQKPELQLVLYDPSIVGAHATRNAPNPNAGSAGAHGNHSREGQNNSSENLE